MDRRSAELIGWSVWFLLFTVVTAMIASGSDRTVVTNYLLGGESWAAGKPLYNESGVGFIYLPHFAVVFAPLSFLPTALVEILWRVVTIGTFATGVLRLTRLFDRENSAKFWLLTSIICIPLCFSAARNGQATLVMGGLMMHVCADLAVSKFKRSALLLWVAVAVKPLAFVLLALVAATHRQTRRPLIVGLAVMLIAPFLFQSPAYVASQMLAVPQSLTDAHNGGQSIYWAQLFGMLKVFGMQVGDNSQLAPRLLLALATLGLFVYARSFHAGHYQAAILYSLAATYILLLNPRTENNTYALIAPAIGLWMSVELFRNRRKSYALLLWVMALGTVGSYEFGKFLTPREQSIWLAPLMALCFACYAVQQVVFAKRIKSNIDQSRDSTETSDQKPIAIRRAA